MTPESIAKARKIIAAATPGPWEFDPDVAFSEGPNRITAACRNTGLKRWINIAKVPALGNGAQPTPDGFVNAKFIAAARNPGGWEDCLNEIERLQGIITANNLTGLTDAANVVRELREERDRLLADKEKRNARFEHEFGNEPARHVASEKALIEERDRLAELNSLLQERIGPVREKTYKELESLRSSLGMEKAKYTASAAREKALTEERDQLLEAMELKDKLIAHQREQHAAREKVLVEALEFTVKEFTTGPSDPDGPGIVRRARAALAKLQAAEGGDL